MWASYGEGEPNGAEAEKNIGLANQEPGKKQRVKTAAVCALHAEHHQYSHNVSLRATDVEEDLTQILRFCIFHR